MRFLRPSVPGWRSQGRDNKELCRHTARLGVGAEQLRPSSPHTCTCPAVAPLRGVGWGYDWSHIPHEVGRKRAPPPTLSGLSIDCFGGEMVPKSASRHARGPAAGPRQAFKGREGEGGTVASM